MENLFRRVEFINHGGHAFIFKVIDGNAELALKLFYGKKQSDIKRYALAEESKLALLRGVKGVPTIYTIFPNLNLSDFGELPFQPPICWTRGFTMELRLDTHSLDMYDDPIPKTYFDQLIEMAREVHSRGLAFPDDIGFNLHISENGEPVIFDWGNAEYLPKGRGRATAITDDYNYIRTIRDLHCR